MKRSNFLLLGGVVILSACGTPPLTNDQQCQAFGAVSGSNAYVNCMSKLAERDAVVLKKQQEQEEADEEQKKRDEEEQQSEQDTEQYIQQQQDEDDQLMQQLDDQMQQENQQNLNSMN